MSKNITVFSTITADVRYVEWKKGGGDVPVEGRSVLIKGGAGLATKHLITPQGIATFIDAEELAVLRADYTFKRHEANGFIKVVEGSGAKADANVVAADMASRDNSAPIVPGDFPDAPDDQKVELSTGKKSTKKK